MGKHTDISDTYTQHPAASSLGRHDKGAVLHFACLEMAKSCDVFKLTLEARTDLSHPRHTLKPTSQPTPNQA